MKLGKDEMKHLGKLANLDLSEVESEKFGSQLAEILGFVEKLSRLDTSRVSPLTNVMGRKNIFREDKIQKSLSQRQALANAPAKYKGYFKVKAIFGK